MRSVLITGAAGGMGRAAAELFCSRGFRVFALDKKSCPAVDDLIPLTADLTDPAAVAAAFEQVRSRTAELWGILHLAGVYRLDSLAEMEPAAFEEAFRINLGAAFLVNKTFLPLLGEGSRVILVTSELAVRDPLPFTGIYGITKKALDAYAYSLGMELQLLGIRVSVLRAGAVDTGMLGESTRQLDRFCRGTKLYSCNAARFKEIVDRVEARRIPPSKLAEKLWRIGNARRPRFAYSLNRNPLLILLDALPVRTRFFLIRKLLK